MMNPSEDFKPQANNLLIERFKALYAEFNTEKLDDLGSIYTQDVEFHDPVHVVNGLLGLKRYFRNQTQALTSCKFHYLSEIVGDDKAFIRWEMEFSHPSIAGGKTMVLPGMSEIQYSHRIFFQQDSYDLGAMLYEHIPVIGFLLKLIKNRLK